MHIPFNENPVFVIIVFAVFPRSIILFLFSVMMQFTVNSHNNDALRIAQLTYLKETDARTHVFNKNKYQEMITVYYPKIDRVAVIFWDLNNLKRINDAFGHASGDKAIRILSSALHRYTNSSCRTYRIGGDEFLMIIDNPVPEMAETIIATVKKKLELATDQEEFKISSAVGLAFGKGKEILQVVEAADAKMYENKKAQKKREK